MRHFVNAACGLWLAAAGAVHAEPVVVVELYTSQGCSSCPPADEFLAMMASDPRILPLALHVDYWDYIGWEDKFAQAKFSDRQRAYAKAVGSRTIYTPQLIIGGADRIEGFSPEETAERLRDHLAAGTPGSADGHAARRYAGHPGRGGSAADRAGTAATCALHAGKDGDDRARRECRKDYHLPQHRDVVGPDQRLERSKRAGGDGALFRR